MVIINIPAFVNKMLMSYRPEYGDYSILAAEITDKTEEEVEDYFNVFAKKWKTLAGMSSVPTRKRLSEHHVRVSPHPSSDYRGRSQAK